MGVLLLGYSAKTLQFVLLRGPYDGHRTERVVYLPASTFSYKCFSDEARINKSTSLIRVGGNLYEYIANDFIFLLLQSKESCYFH